MVGALGRSITQARMEGAIKGVPKTNGEEPSTHQHFVDDTMLFGEGSGTKAYACKDILGNYTEASSQEINKDKSEIFFFNTSSNLEAQVCAILNFNKVILPYSTWVPLNSSHDVSKL